MKGGIKSESKDHSSAITSAQAIHVALITSLKQYSTGPLAMAYHKTEWTVQKPTQTEFQTNMVFSVFLIIDTILIKYRDELQWSVLVPTLFFIATSDFPIARNCKAAKHVNDTTV